MTGRDWRGESLEHLRRSWPSWLTAYDIARKLRGHVAGHGSGRDSGQVRKACDAMTAEGLLESRLITQEGAPYGKAFLQFRFKHEKTEEGY